MKTKGKITALNLNKLTLKTKLQAGKPAHEQRTK